MPVTQTLNESLGALPSGRVVTLTDDTLTKFLREKYKDNDAEKGRRVRMSRRLDFYRDRAEPHVNKMLDDIFKNAKVREWRKKFTPYSGFQNITMRVTRETASVYSEPALRTVTNDQQGNYRRLQRQTRMDRHMRQVNRLGNLTNNVLIWPDVRDGEMRLRVITQNKFWAISDPNDPTRAVGFVVDMKPEGPVAVRDTGPHFLGIDGQTFFRLDQDWRLVAGSRYPHNVGRLPVVLYSREASEDCVLDAYAGEDLIHAHLSIALLNILMLKAQKAGTRQPVFSGDLSATALDQPMDEEQALNLGEGVSATTLDLTADPETYIKAARSVIKQIAANRGIPESVFDLSYEATSGFEIELKRVGLQEVRRDQMVDFEHTEEELAGVESSVLKAAGHSSAFDMDGWAIEFGEMEIKSPTDRLNYFEKAEALDQMDRVAMYRAMHPNADPREAAVKVLANRKERLKLMVEFQQKNAGAFGPGSTQPAAGEGKSEDDEDDEEEDLRALAREILSN